MIWTYACGFMLLPLQVTLKPVDGFSWNCVHAVEFPPPPLPYSWRTDYKFCVITSSKNVQFFLGAITKLRKATISFVILFYRKILNIKDVKKLQTDLDSLGDWAERNEMKINPNKSKALSFTRAVKDPLNYSLGDQKIPEASCCKYLGIIIWSDLS